MIRLIASDIDGTLLKEATCDLNPEYFRVIKNMAKQGVRFAAVSGRGFESVENLMRPVREDVILMSDNGAYISDRGKALRCISFSPELKRRIIAYMKSLSGVRFIFLSAVDGSFTDSDDEEMIRWNEESYHLKMNQAEDLFQVSSETMKIAMYAEGDASELAGPARAHFAGSGVQITESGAHWIDFVPEGADKGNGLAFLRDVYGIAKEETIAFGDNNNDISMILQAGEGYAVAEAREELKAAATHVIGSYQEDSVLKVLKELFPGV